MAPATLRSQGLLDETSEASPPPVSYDTAIILAAIGNLTNEVKDLKFRVERLESKSPPTSPLVKPEDSAKKTAPSAPPHPQTAPQPTVKEVDESYENQEVENTIQDQEKEKHYNGLKVILKQVDNTKAIALKNTSYPAFYSFVEVINELSTYTSTNSDYTCVASIMLRDHEPQKWYTTLIGRFMKHNASNPAKPRLANSGLAPSNNIQILGETVKRLLLLRSQI